MIKTFIKSIIPVRLRPAVRRQYERSRAALNALLRQTDPIQPPENLIFVGGDGSNFQQLGEKWLQTFIQYGGLRPQDRVLDVGCGVGRMAVPLTNYLAGGGSYDGFDIVNEGIEWCQQNITPRFPQFRFQHADMFNKVYNPAGKIEAAAYRFPYPDNTFNFVFLTSVFTHMMPRDVDNYLSEIGRVMRPGGRCLITFFLLNEESLRRIEAGEVDPSRAFKHDIQGCRIVDPAKPEAAIAYPEELVLKMYKNSGLEIVEPIHHGGWPGRQDARHAQDFIVARKP